MTPESVRWNLAKGKIKEAQGILRKAASVNGKTISENALEKLGIEEPEVKHKDPMLKVFQSKILLLRFITACFCWITCAFLFYGITLSSVSLAGNSYLDFILTSLVEIPAYFACYVVVDRIGRRASQCGSFFLTGIACITFIFMPKGKSSKINIKKNLNNELLSDIHWGALIVYLIGKFGATAAFTVVYISSSEIFPTNLRNSMIGTCSMFGRIGSMISPQMPLLVSYYYICVINCNLFSCIIFRRKFGHLYL